MRIYIMSVHLAYFRVLAISGGLICGLLEFVALQRARIQLRRSNDRPEFFPPQRLEPPRPALAGARQSLGAAPKSQVLKLLQLAVEFIRAAILIRQLFPRLARGQQLREIQQWATKLVRILQVEVDCNQPVPVDGAVLCVSNHLSWLDILVIQSLMPGVFVAKAQVRRWPVIGSMARACATIFVERSSARSTHAMVDSAAAALQQGTTVIAFPEGTSSDGSDLAPFHANIFEGAVRARTPVQPVTLRYVNIDTGAPSEAALFTGDMTLLTSLRNVIRTSNIRVHVHMGESLPAEGQTRISLCHQAQQAIRAQLLANDRMDCFDRHRFARLGHNTAAAFFAVDRNGGLHGGCPLRRTGATRVQ